MSEDPHYDPNFAGFLEEVWGKGYLSPGGPEEVARVLDGLDLKGKRVLDIGCGTGAITIALREDHGAGQVVGLDVEDPVCDLARANVADAGLSDCIEIVRAEPGPFPFPDGSFDVVFSKDSIVHVADKEALAEEVFRLLAPDGVFAASDWLISHDGPPSPDMAHYIALEDIDLNPASPARYEAALNAAGFEDVRTINRNRWYHEVAQGELAMIQANRAEYEARFGAGLIADNIEIWTAMVAVLATGEHCPHHLRGTKPGA